MGLNGVMLLLKAFRIKTQLPVTQMMSQSFSAGLSQLSGDAKRGVNISNEAVCADLQGVLRRYEF